MLKFVIFIAILVATTSLANNVPECSPSEKEQCPLTCKERYVCAVGYCFVWVPSSAKYCTCENCPGGGVISDLISNN